MSQWHDLFVAEAGAAAALAGLLFVAVSINLERILKFPALPARAAETPATLIVVVLISTFVLVPARGRVALGAELLALSMIVWCFAIFSRLRRGVTSGQTRPQYVLELSLNQLAILPFVAAGVSLLAHSGGGLYWTVPGLAFVFVYTTLNAWVLLVEIMR